MPETPAIQVAQLHKSYGGTEVLRGLTLSVPAGSIYALLGRNGAGKTTTVKVLLGMARATSGSARVLDLPCALPDASVEIRRRTAFVSEDKGLYDHLTVGGMLRFAAAVFPNWVPERAAHYLQSFGLNADARVRALSRGMRTKLSILLALARRADLMILDEPTSGLDPAATEEVLQALIRRVAEDGVTVFFSSHHIALVEQFADHVAIIDRGRTLVAAPLDELREKFTRIRFLFDREAPQRTFRSNGIHSVRSSGRVLTILTSGDPEEVLEEAQLLRAASTDVTPLTLKEIFLEFAGTKD